MKAHVFRGSKREIAESLIRLSAEVREAIIFEEEPTATTTEQGTENVFVEMEPFLVDVERVDDSREAK